jgi:antitoxin component YwqK of YwqJK toxin-antitoxin module
MNIYLIQQKVILALLFMLPLSSNVFSQKKPNQVEINGEKMYVYPYGQKYRKSYSYSRLMNYLSTDELKKVYAFENPKYVQEDLDNFIAGVERFKDRMKKQNPKAPKNMLELLKIANQNSERFNLSTFSMDQDITPSLDPLPDGKYVQYYESYFWINPQGVMEQSNQRIAGIFELKNNQLSGMAYWLNPIQDTVKMGRYENAMKQGKWMLKAYEPSFYNNENLTEFMQSPITYFITYVDFVHGISNGKYERYKGKSIVEKGNYSNGKPSGEWFIYNTKRNYLSDRVVDTSHLVKHYTIASDRILSHKRFVRTASFPDYLPKEKYNLPRYNLPDFDFTNLISWGFAEDEDLELPEEKATYYDGADEEMYAYDEMMGDPEMYFENEFYNNTFYLSGKEFTKSKIIDSIGYYVDYTGMYEEFHPNGELKIRYEFKNGDFIAENNVYWDNGKIANSIEWNEALNVYEEKLFDYDEVLFTLNHYDKNGDFLKQVIDPLYDENHIQIEGVMAEIIRGYQTVNYYKYSKVDTLNYELKSPVTLLKSWYPNKTLMEDVKYDPITRIVQSERKSFNGKTLEKQEFEYSEDFSNYRSKSMKYFKNLSVESLENGSFNSSIMNFESEFGAFNFFKDTFPQARIMYDYVWDYTTDQVVNVNDKVFTGSFEYVKNAKKNKFSISPKAIRISLVNTQGQSFKMKKDMESYQPSQKSKFDDIYSWVDHEGNIEQAIFDFFPLLNNFNRYGYYDNKAKVLKEIYAVKGKFLNGKPEGEWKAFNAKGNVLIECFYKNGELQGEYKDFDIELPLSLKQEDMYEYFNPVQNFISYPSKPTYYLKTSRNYANDFLDGEYKSFDWQGNVSYQANYVKGLENGTVIERNELVYSKSEYENGMLDGITRTYLTFPGRDSIVLFDLNFQDGLLQGESKSYHTNGKLSKRGFFLNGRAIDDYEGYDTLGFKYHYVKFLYSFPVEEKIWEFNQLSVRYLFDWKDSIFFTPTDITYSSSVENILYEMELMGEEGAPYMGRPSLVNKYGITYHMTKYYPNDTIARDGKIKNSRKHGFWYFNDYDGNRKYEVNYFDTILKINDSIKFKSKGIITYLDENGLPLSKSYIIERIEKYDCSHTDHYETRQYYTIWQKHDSLNRMNGFVKNYYDSGTLQSEGTMKDGLPTGVWKYYDPQGKLNQVGEYFMGKRTGRWLSGDLSKSKYMGDICLNPNIPDLESKLEYQEKLLDIYIRYFKLGKVIRSEYYDLNLNDYEEGKTEE